MPHRAIESLESRRLLTVVGLADLGPDAVDVNRGDDAFVRLVGTDAGETFEIASVSPNEDSPVNRLDVFVDGTLRLRVAIDGFLERFEIDAAGGDDTVIVGQNLPVSGVLDGGDGDDLLGGGPLADVLLGGSGNDTLDGNAGGDVVDGGDGDDLLLGGRPLDGDGVVIDGVVIDGGDVDGEGTTGSFAGLSGRLSESAPFDAAITVDADDESGTFTTDNLTLLDADWLFGGSGTDAAAQHGRTFFGSEVETYTTGTLGPQPTPETESVAIELDLRGDDTLDAAALTLSAVPVAGTSDFADTFDDLVGQLTLLADALDVDLTTESPVNDGPGGVFSRTLVADAAELDDDPIALTDARATTVAGVRDAVLFAAEARRAYAPRTLDFGDDDGSLTFDPTIGDDGRLSGVVA